MRYEKITVLILCFQLSERTSSTGFLPVEWSLCNYISGACRFVVIDLVGNPKVFKHSLQCVIVDILSKLFSLAIAMTEAIFALKETSF